MSMVIGKADPESKPDAKSRDGRDRLLYGAGRLLAERGYAGMELRDVAERGDASRGSIYHHFPGGKAQLAAEAAELDGVRIRIGIERSLVERGLRETLELFGGIFRRQAADDPGRIGCPVAAAALARPEDPALAAAATAAFESWEGAIAAALEREGVAAENAATFAAMVVSTVEGALVRTRAAGDLAPLETAIAGLGQALDALLANATG
jgi:TetR/AcrR family transcriptional regulator, lmrAB and yxaGH operons repressor